MPAIFSVVIPLHNERDHLESSLREILTKAKSVFVNDQTHVELLLIENGSSDGTWEELERLNGTLFKQTPIEVKLLRHPIGDYGFSVRAAMRETRGEKVALASLDWFDEDFFSKALRDSDSYDVVCADKSVKGADTRPGIRRILSAGYRATSKALLQLPVNDTHGLFIARGPLVRLASEHCVTGSGVFPTELFMRMAWGKGSFKALPIKLHEMRASRFNIMKLLRKSVFGLGVLFCIRARNALPSSHGKEINAK